MAVAPVAWWRQVRHHTTGAPQRLALFSAVVLLIVYMVLLTFSSVMDIYHMPFI